MSIHDDARAASEAVYDAHVSNLQTATTRAVTERDRAVADLATVRAQLGDANTAAAGLRAQIAAKDAEIAVLKRRIADLEAPAPTPTPTPTPTPQPTGNLWFATKTPAKRKYLYAHYVPWNPIIITNEPMASDYYARVFLNPAGENGKYADNGAYIRDAPYHEAPYAGSGKEASLETRRLAYRFDIEHAILSGMDGFFVDLVQGPSTANSHWKNIQPLIDEVSENYADRIKVAPMIDANGSLETDTPANIVTHLNRFLDRPSAARLPDGRYIVGVFKAEGAANSVWAAIDAEFARTGKNIYWVGAFNNLSGTRATSSNTNPYSTFDVLGPWSAGADPEVVKNASGENNAIRGRGQTPLFPLLPQGVRAYSSWYDEARGLGCLRTNWDTIIREDAEWVQLVTWNDFAEGSQAMATRKQGTAVGAYNRYRADEWRTGSKPPIVRDTAILSHRNQMLGATIPAGQTPMTQNTSRSNRSTPRDEVEVVTFLTTPRRVTVTVGGQATSYDAPAGEYAQYVTARPGRVRVQFGAIDYTSPITIRSASGNEDREWVHAWVHDTITVSDPTPAQ